MKNIKLVSGTPIPTSNLTTETLQFDMLNFGEVEMVCLKKSNISSTKLKTMMNGKSQLIVIHTIEETGGLDEKIISSADSVGLYEKPCAVLSPAKTIMPQIITPMGDVDICDNGMTTTTSKSLESFLSGFVGFEWFADTKNFLKEYPNVQASVVNDLRNWGVREAQNRNAGYINMSGVKNKQMDSTITRHRRYILHTKNDNMTSDKKKYAGPGACIIGYQFLGGEESGDGTGKETALSPQLVVSLSKLNDTSKEIKISVNPKQGVWARVGEDIGQGSLGQPQSTMMPPNCKNYEDKWKCMFIYPLYSGFVISSEAVKQLSSKGDNSIFIPYSDTKPVFNNAVFTNVTLSKEMYNYMRSHPENTLEWFPTLVRENNRSSIGIGVASNFIGIKNNTATIHDKRMHMDEQPQIEWEKSYGKFFYCPLFFHQKIEFDLYFIGEAKTRVKQLNNSGTSLVNTGSMTYYFYPVITTDIDKDDDVDDKWDDSHVGYGSYMNSVNISTKEGEVGGSVSYNIGDRTYYGKRVVASATSARTDANETIYKVSFKFHAKKPTRYPIEIHGAICVAEKDDVSIPLSKSNGENAFTSPGLGYTTINNYSNFVDKNSNGTAINETYPFLKYATELNVSASLSGVTGGLELDEYVIANLLQKPKLDQVMGQLCLAIQDTDYNPSTSTGIPNIFTGYGMELKKNESESSHSVSINLVGVQKKLEDMKLIAAPFWDGDRLEDIAVYFESYCNVQLKMVDHKIHDISAAKRPTKSNGPHGTWISDSKSIVVETNTAHADFRVPRSANYRKPAVDFKTGTRCLDALNQLAEMTSCVFVVQPDGIGYFFELNKMGIPYYVENQLTDGNGKPLRDKDGKPVVPVSFGPEDIISLNISPYIENKYNTFATMGFQQKINKKTGELEMVSVSPQMIYTPYQTLKNNFPWSRVNVYVENGYMTLSELTEVHTNNVKFGVSEIYQGTVQVKGNNKITHIYQRVKICGVDFFVSSIDHRVDLSSKSWTTNYGLSLYEQAT